MLIDADDDYHRLLRGERPGPDPSFWLGTAIGIAGLVAVAVLIWIGLML